MDNISGQLQNPKKKVVQENFDSGLQSPSETHSVLFNNPGHQTGHLETERLPHNRKKSAMQENPGHVSRRQTYLQKIRSSDKDSTTKTSISGVEECEKISVRVRRSALSNALGNGMNKLGLYENMKNKFKKRISVEGTTHGQFDSLFYAPFPKAGKNETPALPTPGSRKLGTQQNKPPIPEKVQFLGTGFPCTDEEDLVRIGDGFDISVVGMSITPQDAFADSFNELLLYSMHKASDCEGTDTGRPELNDLSVNYTYRDNERQKREDVRDRHYEGHPHSPSKFDNRQTTTQRNFREDISKKPTTFNGYPLPCLDELPRIHYDPFGDGFTAGTLPDTFVSVPASRACVLRQDPASQNAECLETMKKPDSNGADCTCQGISLRFTVLEIDKITQAQLTALAGLESGSQAAAALGASLPFSGLLTTAASTVTRLGSAKLQKYAKPDFVLAKDVFFRLCPRSWPYSGSYKSAADDSESDSSNPEKEIELLNNVSYRISHCADSYLRVS